MSSQAFLKGFKVKKPDNEPKTFLLTAFEDPLKEKPTEAKVENFSSLVPKKVVANPFFEVVSNEEKNIPKQTKKRKIDYTESVFAKDDFEFEVKVNKPIDSTAVIKKEVEKKSTPLSSKHGHQTKWDLEQWIDEAVPSTLTDFQCFVDQAVDNMEGGDRGTPPRQEDHTKKVLAALEETVTNWKKGKKKIHCLIGAPSTGKTMMLKLLAKKHNLEWTPVHEDNPADLKLMLANAGNQSLDSEQQLWVIEHFDFFDKQCKLILRNSFQKLLKQGPVFLTMYPVTDNRSYQQFTVSPCLAWPLSAKILFLEKFGPTMEWEDIYAEGNGELSRILAYGQYSRNIKSMCIERFCTNEECKGYCSICTRKRRIPHNLRLLVEDTLCPRTSPVKEKMLGETDADLSIMLLQEMIPATNCSLDSLIHCYDAISTLDCCTEYSTVVKDAFLSGTIQNLCRTDNIKFSSKNNLAIPEMLFGKNRRTIQGDSRKETLIGKYRGCENYIPRKRATLVLKNDDSDDEGGTTSKKGFEVGSKGLEEAEDKYEYNLGDPQVDTRDLFEDVDLFKQAANF